MSWANRMAAVDKARGMKAPRAKSTHPETKLQIEVVRALRQLTIPPALFWHVSNGGKRDKREAARFKDMGVLAGVSDLHFAWLLWDDVTPMYGVIELKASPSAKPTAAQAAFIEALEGMGHRTAVCASLADVLNELGGWGYPLRLRGSV